jgi:hypothetical protein
MTTPIFGVRYFHADPRRIANPGGERAGVMVVRECASLTEAHAVAAALCAALRTDVQITEDGKALHTVPAGRGV